MSARGGTKRDLLRVIERLKAENTGLQSRNDELLEALREARVGLLFAGADQKIQPGDFVPTPTLALRAVRAALTKLGSQSPAAALSPAEGQTPEPYVPDARD